MLLTCAVMHSHCSLAWGQKHFIRKRCINNEIFHLRRRKERFQYDCIFGSLDGLYYCTDKAVSFGLSTGLL